MEQFVLLLVASLIAGGIGALIGNNRKIGAGWGFVLCFFLGLIGLIITICSDKKGSNFVEINKNEKI